MIARQRQNLQRTFALSEQTKVEPGPARRLARTERELAEATAEFTEGLEQRFGPVPCLHEAQEAMLQAVAALDRKDARAGGESEEAALAGLIKARQNLRQFLKDSNSASACRQFDAKQRQKLRKPPGKDERAKLRQEIEKLAREEKKLGEEMSGSSSGDSSSSAKADRARRQEKAAEKAGELQEMVRKDEALTELARERMDAAADTIRGSERSLKAGREREAGEQAAEAAEQLGRLARQVAGLHAADLNARLAHSQGMARQLARQQQEMARGLQEEGQAGGKTPKDGRGEAAGQRGQAEEARTLADLLDRLREDAAGTDPKLGEALRQAAEANPPSAIAAQMRRAAEALQAGRAGPARRDVDQSARMLGALSQQLDAARRALVGPELAKLAAAEKQAADTQKALGSVHDERQKAEAEKKVGDLRDTMESLRPTDGKLAEAATSLTEALGRSGGWSRRQPPLKPNEGLYVPPTVYDDSVRKVIQALQARIQEIILKDAMLDRDEPVPPQYRGLVEEYYRLLSEDLR